MKKEEFKKVWEQNPNKAETIVYAANKAYIESERRGWLKEFAEEIQVYEIKPRGYRAIGSGLVHKLIDTDISIDTIFGKFEGNAKDVLSQIEDCLNNDWLKTLFENPKEIIWGDQVFKEAIKKALNREMDNLPVNFLTKTPDFALAAVIEFIWSLLVERPGEVISIEDKNGVLQVTCTKSGIFVGKNGKNIAKISALIKREISVFEA